MPVKYKGRLTGFPQRHSTVPSSKFALECGLDRLIEPGSKVRSRTTLSSIREDLLKFDNSSVRPSDASLDFAISQAFNHFNVRGRGVLPIHLNDIFDMPLTNWNTSPGNPFIFRGYRTKDDVRRDPAAVTGVRHFAHRIKLGDHIPPPDCLAYVRSHLAPPDEPKTRAVWGYPASLSFMEATFALPLIQAYIDANTPIAFGYETAVGGAYRIRREASGNPEFLCADFEGFDKYAPVFLIRIAFDVLRYQLSFTRYAKRGIPNCERLQRLWDYLVEYFINTPIRLANGERYQKESGIASGSYFTSLVGSIVNYIIITWAFHKCHGRAPGYLLVFGDDSYLGDKEVFTTNDLDIVASSIGMKVNSRKTICTSTFTETTFLGYRLSSGGPSKPTSDWLIALINPEMEDLSWDRFASRALGLHYACQGRDDFFSKLTAAIVRLRPFDLDFGRAMQRYLKINNIQPTIKLPNELDWFIKTG